MACVAGAAAAAASRPCACSAASAPCLPLQSTRGCMSCAQPLSLCLPQLLEPLTGKTVQLSSYAAGAPATLVMFICNHCPFVVHLKPALTELAKEYQEKGVKVLAISSNSVETHPQASTCG